ncbi:hypothetical protein CVT26_008336 [Gymnopilus dilepis]|uniref:Uncharacterized protein n=1 Tax=Gymnopilus dilepis TaxID=231916 RepID=A0A409XY78_9AGAR|nr:hypothetical protein CVT26_008336 [Gymnopilus dilepis]
MFYAWKLIEHTVAIKDEIKHEWRLIAFSLGGDFCHLVEASGKKMGGEEPLHGVGDEFLVSSEPFSWQVDDGNREKSRAGRPLSVDHPPVQLSFFLSFIIVVSFVLLILPAHIPSASPSSAGTVSGRCEL